MFHSIPPAPSAWTRKTPLHRHSCTPFAAVGNVKPFRIGFCVALLTTTLVSTQVFSSLIAPAQAVDFRALWQRFFETDPPEPGTPGGTRGPFEFCNPKPGDPLEPIAVWSDRPSVVFEWKVMPSEIALYRSGESDPLWTQLMTEAHQVTWVDRVDQRGDAVFVYHVTYNGEALLSGQEEYVWKVSSDFGGAVPGDIGITVMSEDEQGAIAQDLATLDALERLNGADEDAIALQRADYFAERELWSDFWNEVMRIESPSEELQDLSEATLRWFCTEENSAASSD